MDEYCGGDNNFIEGKNNLFLSFCVTQKIDGSFDTSGCFDT